MPVSFWWMVSLFAVLMPRLSAAQAIVSPGDLRLRSDLQLLVDERIIDLPIMTWPIPAADIAQALRASARAESSLSDASAAAWSRVESMVRDPGHGSGNEVRISGADKPVQLRSFADGPRTSGEIDVSGSISGDGLIAQLHLGAVAAPGDRQVVRFDGSYVTYTAGNWILGPSAADRWWGPGWEGSLILSNAARPIPAMILERMTSSPFETRWLKWIGRWRLSALLGQLEQNRAGVRSPLYLGARIVAKPQPWLELAVSRSIIFCGSGRPCGFSAWKEALLQQQNPGGGYGPGLRFDRAQLAGFDLRLSSPWRRIPAALYAQMIGEDGSGGIPFKYLGILGAESWATTSTGAVLRGHVEFADTACSFYRQRPLYGCAYHDTLYSAGIRYRGAPIGDSLDSDSQAYSAGIQLTLPSGADWSILGRSGRLNRGGVYDAQNSVTPVPQKFRSADLRWRQRFDANQFEIVVGFERRETPSTGLIQNSPRSSVRWSHQF